MDTSKLNRIMLTLCVQTAVIILYIGKSDANYKEVHHGPKEYCEGSTFKAVCGVDESIMISSARYGRMHEGKCITGANMGCDTDVIGILDQRCSGRRSCVVNVVDVFQHIPENKRPCSNNFRGFLEVSYKCVKVLKAKDNNCMIDLQTIVYTEGYLPTRVGNKTQCGTSNKPWRVKIAPEQQINLFLYDFAFLTRNPQDPSGQSTCKVYVVIKEEKVPNSDTVCGQYQREKLVYQSMSDEMEIRIMEKVYHFLIKYQIIGCGGIKVPNGGWVKRNGDIAEIGCDRKDTKWQLVCNNNVWTGHYENCTDEDGSELSMGASSSHDGGGLFGDMFGSHWLTVLAITAIAITVAICILVAGIIYIKRKHVYLSHGNHPGDDPNNLSYKYGTGGMIVANPPGGQSHYNEQGIPYRAFDPNDHEYLKTIERQRLMLIGQHPQQHFATINHFNWPPDSSLRKPEVTEHIYELPKFETEPSSRDGSMKCGGERVIPPPPPPPLSSVGGRIPIQGLDFDPHPAIKMGNGGGGGGGGHGSNTQPNNTNAADAGLRNVNNRSV